MVREVVLFMFDGLPGSRVPEIEASRWRTSPRCSRHCLLMELKLDKPIKNFAMDAFQLLEWQVQASRNPLQRHMGDGNGAEPATSGAYKSTNANPSVNIKRTGPPLRCKCGGTDHQRISSKKCPLYKPRQKYMRDGPDPRHHQYTTTCTVNMGFVATLVQQKLDPVIMDSVARCTDIHCEVSRFLTIAMSSGCQSKAVKSLICALVKASCASSFKLYRLSIPTAFILESLSETRQSMNTQVNLLAADVLIVVNFEDSVMNYPEIPKGWITIAPESGSFSLPLKIAGIPTSIESAIYSACRPPELRWNDGTGLGKLISNMARQHSVKCQNHITINMEKMV
ncbi:hypothetical protein MP228_011769 [Amoeboaphelidium protococcarum]|nr:hypothetical protein MP228_011769 [Amoeboaphelidium protococcarum]